MPEGTPLVGITGYVTPARIGPRELAAAVVPASYVDAVERAGGRPVLLPPAADGAAETLDAIDALVFSGGSDIDPGLYGQRPHPATDGVDRRRDDAELLLLRGALDRDLPVLGICRGAQVINVGLGGDLHQHLPDVVGHQGHGVTEPGRYLDHDVTVAAGTRLARIVAARTTVKSHHHQGFHRLGAGLVAAARADDGVVEAVEAPGRGFVLGVQWHPEVSSDLSLFEALVAEARRYRVGRRGVATPA